MQLYADIVLPLAQPVYTFAVPGGTDVAAGQAVAVQFGARKFYTGIVWRVHDRRPDFKTVKPIQRGRTSYCRKYGYHCFRYYP